MTWDNKEMIGKRTGLVILFFKKHTISDAYIMNVLQMKKLEEHKESANNGIETVRQMKKQLQKLRQIERNLDK